MAATSQFANRYRKDLSIENIRTKIARRKSLSQKENRHQQFEKSRQLRVGDVNIQVSKGKGLPRLDETNEVLSPEKGRAKRKPTTNAATKENANERVEMLRRFKEEKELRKLKEQRERAQRGVFKVGRYKPEVPGFLPPVPQNPVTGRPNEQVAPASMVRITRSKAKNQEEQTAKMPRSRLPVISTNRANHGPNLRSAKAGCKQECVQKVTEKERKVVQPTVLTVSSARVTRAACSATARQIPKPGTIAGNPPPRKAANEGKQQKEVKDEKTLPLKLEVEQNIELDPPEEEPTPNSQNPAAQEFDQDEVFLEKGNVPTTHLPVPARTRMCSFAPQNFVFQPLEGLATYKVTPMTPSRANSFLTPDLSWSPRKTNVTSSEEATREARTQESDLNSQTSPALESTNADVQEWQAASGPLNLQKDCSSSKNKDAVPSATETIFMHADIPAAETKSDITEEPEHDVSYFRNVLRVETERLTSYCLQWNGTSELDIAEESKDLIRTTVGQTRLLIAERFKQFEGLVDNCEFKRGEKETTCTDLDGFWDMVKFQVDDVSKKFADLGKLQANGWNPVNIAENKRPPKKKTVHRGITKPKQRAAAGAAARKRLAAVKAALKSNMKQEEAAAGETEDSERPKEVGKVVFDAGFFRVESPAKYFPDLPSKAPSRSSQRLSKQLTTPRSARKTLLQSTFAALCNSEGNIVQQGAPAASGLISPAGKLLLGRTPEQSNSQAAASQEESCPMIQDPEEGINETCTTAHEGNVLPGDGDSSISVNFEALENPGARIDIPEVTEEMEQFATGPATQEILMGSPAESSQPGGSRTPECDSGRLLNEFPCETPEGATPNLLPSLDCSLPFTPLRNKGQMLTAAETCKDLIVFSPLPPASVEK